MAKYGTAAPTSGRTASTPEGPRGSRRGGPDQPPCAPTARPAAMLKAVRYHGCRRRTFTVHCPRTPTAAIAIARSAPAVAMTVKSTT